MKQKANLLEQLKYRFDNTLSKGPIAIIGWLAFASFLIILISGILLYFSGIAIDSETNEKLSFMEGIWQSLMRALDSGAVGGDEGWSFRTFMLVVTIGGIFIVSALIGAISGGIDQGIENLRKGKSRVLESNHTLILGYSSKLYSIIEELCIANENQKNSSIVILADMDKVEMEDDIQSKIGKTGKTKIIIRSGSPLESTDIAVVNPHEARSIIILSPENEENPDTHVLKSVLAITNSKSRKKEAYHIVAEIKDIKNLEVVMLVGGKEAVYVLSSDLISKLTAQTCRQSGLSIVYLELMRFEGDEIYFAKEPSLIGKTYRDCVFAYETSSIIGISKANGEVIVNPKLDYIVEQNDSIIAISEDDDTIKISGKQIPTFNESVFRTDSKTSAQIERTIILGWNYKGEKIITELDNYVLKGSELVILADSKELEESIDTISQQLQNIKLKYIVGDINHKDTLESLKIEGFDHIILLSYTENISVQESDAKTLICLLHLRNISEKAHKDFSIVSEMLDIRNRELAEVAKADDFIVSDILVSLVLTQISENKELEKVYKSFFEADGSEIYLKDASQFVEIGVELDYYTVLESALRQGQTAIGYRIEKHSQDSSRMYGVRINPIKSQKITFSQGDKVIVLAEN